MKLSLPITIVLYGILLPTHSATSAPCQAQSASAEPLALTPAEITQLINECGKRTTQMTGRLYNYTFTVTKTDYVIDKKGGVKREQSKVFEVYRVPIGKRGGTIYVQVSENGVPFSPEKVARERERAAKQIMELQQLADTGQDRQPNPSYKARFYTYPITVEKHRYTGLLNADWGINPTAFLVSHDFFAPRRIIFAGRETLLLNFRPRPGYVYDKSNVPYPDGVEEYGRVMSHLGGRIWIDALDKVIVRLEAKPLRELSEPDAVPNTAPDPNVPLWFEFTRLPNGTWAPSVSRYNSYGREDVFWKTPLSRLWKYSDYKLFQTTVEMKTNEAVPEKP